MGSHQCQVASFSSYIQWFLSCLIIFNLAHIDLNVGTDTDFPRGHSEMSAFSGYETLSHNFFTPLSSYKIRKGWRSMFLRTPSSHYETTQTKLECTYSAGLFVDCLQSAVLDYKNTASHCSADAVHPGTATKKNPKRWSQSSAQDFLDCSAWAGLHSRALQVHCSSVWDGHISKKRWHFWMALSESTIPYILRCRTWLQL